MRIGPDRRQVSLWNRRRDDIFDNAPIDRYEADGAPIPWLGNQVDLDALERYDEQATSVVRDQHFRQALEFHGELEGQAQMWLDHARVRKAEADYLEHTVFPAIGNPEYLRLANTLREARPMAFWGVDPIDEQGVVQWVNRAGQVKLCPDDARADQQRAVKLYTDRIVELGDQGHVIRFGVLTMPNAPQWHLRACLDATFLRFRREIMYARTDGKIARRVDDPKRRFPDLVGAWACLETPLSARHAHERTASWNVHLNVLLVFKPGSWPPYQALNEAWGAWTHYQKVQAGSRDAASAAIRELIKYPMKAVSLKTLEKASSGKSHAPPMIEWPAECFDEWWRAHKGLRRTRAWGALHGCTAPEFEKRDPDRCDWIGRIRLTAALCDVSRPMPDYMAVRDRLRERREWRQAIDADVIAAKARQLDPIYSIQGNKLAGGQPRAGPDPPEKSITEWLHDYQAIETDNWTAYPTSRSASHGASSGGSRPGVIQSEAMAQHLAWRRRYRNA